MVPVRCPVGYMTDIPVPLGVVPEDQPPITGDTE